MEDVKTTTGTEQTTEPTTEQKTDPTTPASEVGEGEKPEVTVESIMAELAQAKAEAEKSKKALDKALKEKGDLTKKYRETLTEQQRVDMEKQEQDEEHRLYVLELEEFKRKTEAKERYMLQGMSVEVATKAAEAEVTGDMEALSEIQRQHTENELKAAKEEWQKSIPQIQFGTGEYSSMTKDEILKISNPQERQRAIAQNLNLFK